MSSLFSSDIPTEIPWAGTCRARGVLHRVEQAVHCKSVAACSSADSMLLHIVALYRLMRFSSALIPSMNLQLLLVASAFEIQMAARTEVTCSMFCQDFRVLVIRTMEMCQHTFATATCKLNL